MTPVSLQPSGLVVGDGEIDGRISDEDAKPLPEEVTRNFHSYLVNWAPKAGTLPADGENSDHDEALNNTVGLQDDDLMEGLSASGITIGERELQLAAGAAYRGGDPDTVLASYRRYVAALKGLKTRLNEDLHPLVDEAIEGLESLIQLIDQNRNAGEPERLAMGKDVLSALEPGQRVLLPAAVRGHAMVAELGRFEDGSFYVRIYNSGAGVAAHHFVEPGQGGKYSTFVEYRFDSIQAQDLARLFEMSDPFGGTADVNAVYDWAQTLPGSVKTPRASGQYTYQATQQSNDCALESVHS